MAKPLLFSSQLPNRGGGGHRGGGHSRCGGRGGRLGQENR